MTQRVARLVYAGAGYIGFWNAVALIEPGAPMAWPSGAARIVPLGWLTDPGALQGAAVAVGVAALAFGLGLSDVLAPLVVFLGVGAVTTVAASMTPDGGLFSHSGVLVSVTLLAYVLGWSVATGQDSAARRRVAWEFTTPLVSACYFLAALSKLGLHGTSWGDGPTMALLVEERRYGAGAMLEAARGALAVHPSAVAALAWAAVLIELLSPLYMLPHTRFRWLAAVVCMHCGIGVILGYHYLDWILIDCAIFVLTDPGRA